GGDILKAVNKWLGVIMFIFGSALTFFSLRIPVMDGKSPGPGFLPLIIGITIIILGIALIAVKNVDDNEKVDWPSGIRLLRLVVSIGAIAIYIFLMTVIGFAISTFLFLFGLITYWGDYFSWRRPLTLAILLTVVTYF